MYHGHHVALPMCLPRGMVLGQPPIHPLVRNVCWGGGAPPNEPPPLFLVKWRFPACKHCPRGEAAKWFWSLRKGWRGGGVPPLSKHGDPVPLSGSQFPQDCRGGVEKHPSASACDCRRQRCGGLPASGRPPLHPFDRCRCVCRARARPCLRTGVGVEPGLLGPRPFSRKGGGGTSFADAANSEDGGFLLRL